MKIHTLNGKQHEPDAATACEYKISEKWERGVDLKRFINDH